MPFVSILNSTPEATDANAYCTAAQATAYLTQWRLYTPEWSAATLATQEAAIIWASRMIDVSFDFHGKPSNVNQAMRWPRIGIKNIDGYYVDWTTIPQIVVEATAAFAYELVKKNRPQEPGVWGQGFTNVSLGPLRIDGISRDQVLPLIPTYIVVWLEQFGSVKGLGQGGSNVSQLRRA